MVSYQDIVEKMKRRVSKEEYETGINNYVNAPDFEEKYQEQVNKAVQGYKDAGAPEDWAIKQELKLRLVSADGWKQAITSAGVSDAYYNKLMTALEQKAKMFAIPAEQGNLIQDIIRELGITDAKKRMDANFAVGQHLLNAVLYRLAGDSANLDAEIEALITDLFSYGIIPDDGTGKPDATISDKVKQLVLNRVENCVSELTS